MKIQWRYNEDKKREKEENWFRELYIVNKGKKESQGVKCNKYFKFKTREFQNI